MQLRARLDEAFPEPMLAKGCDRPMGAGRFEQALTTRTAGQKSLVGPDDPFGDVSGYPVEGPRDDGMSRGKMHDAAACAGDDAHRLPVRIAVPQP